MKYFYILHFYNNITQMLDTCSYCSSIINKSNSIYFGYDNIYCSKGCRIEVTKIIIKKDPILVNPQKWKNISRKDSKFDLENLKNNFKVNSLENNQSVIKKTKSYRKQVSELLINDNDNDETSKNNDETSKNNDETSKNNDETSKNNDETSKNNDETSKNNDETSKNNDETSKNNDETSKNNDERSCYTILSTLRDYLSYTRMRSFTNMNLTLITFSTLLTRYSLFIKLYF